ncbi:MAG TPA: hypothetical protein VFB54_07100 [Burkholderiales bacterium]|nr:hypothetical protein [Burkholderiales bacterium]
MNQLIVAPGAESARDFAYRLAFDPAAPLTPGREKKRPHGVHAAENLETGEPNLRVPLLLYDANQRCGATTRQSKFCTLRYARNESTICA